MLKTSSNMDQHHCVNKRSQEIAGGSQMRMQQLPGLPSLPSSAGQGPCSCPARYREALSSRSRGALLSRSHAPGPGERQAYQDDGARCQPPPARVRRSQCSPGWQGRAGLSWSGGRWAMVREGWGETLTLRICSCNCSRIDSGHLSRWLFDSW